MARQLHQSISKTAGLAGLYPYVVATTYQKWSWEGQLVSPGVMAQGRAAEGDLYSIAQRGLNTFWVKYLWISVSTREYVWFLRIFGNSNVMSLCVFVYISSP